MLGKAFKLPAVGCDVKEYILQIIVSALQLGNVRHIKIVAIISMSCVDIQEISQGYT